MKRIATSSLVGLSALVIAASNASAQMCNGTASFSAGRMRAGVGLSFGDGYSTIDGEFAYGARSGLYGGATLNLIDYENTTESATGFGLNGGKAMLIGTAKKVEMCPQVVLNFSSGPNVGTTEISSSSLGAGVSFGTLMNASTSFDLVPFGGAFIRRNAMEVTNGTTTAEDSDVDLDLAVGAGFVFGKKWTLRPAISIPVTADGADPVFQIMGSLNFGK
ncbi:MAG TPA: hypothetical protein VFO55_11335 [Gemmatimonadaceae bacterium]|nr:hypothetical protein [Gemmatimonadaceae bacterium]